MFWRYENEGALIFLEGLYCCKKFILWKKWESIPRQVDKNSKVPKEEKGVWALKEDIGVWHSQKGGKGKRFFPSIFLSLSSIKLFFFKPWIDDYTTKNSV